MGKRAEKKVKGIGDLSAKERMFADLLADSHKHGDKGIEELGEMLGVSKATAHRYAALDAVQELAVKRYRVITSKRRRLVEKVLYKRATEDSGVSDRKLFLDRADRIDLKDKGFEKFDADEILLIIRKTNDK